ncbi:DUF4392 domain-containing protein [Bowmanella pacifica]|uniref:D-glutamate cyclase-like C-terminal domain-containing protein n=1 Tax=Bowmanella pacifica TaxID=502051 RepID=A0A918DG29_9ALTE|nr:glutamate cyclase domain-containing protein [Bowmanella pacifica]GGO64672.1 hypothetical protein GCM10010982_04660 [Bowmanella pacifica]
MSDALLHLSRRIEDLLVARNIRGMQGLQAALSPGYLLRAATLLNDNPGTVLIGTGFPVTDTFETDGPVGAVALYNALKTLGYRPVLVCGEPLFSALSDDYQCIRIRDNELSEARRETRQVLQQYAPSMVISIERPGLSEDGRYYNMRSEDISDRCACYDYFLIDSDCPTIAIGDGGNEIGMGKVLNAVKALNIVPSVTSCDELVVADVSNWAAYGILALLGKLRGVDLLDGIQPEAILSYLSKRGSVDGVTRENTLTEDSLCFTAGVELIEQIRSLWQSAP